MKNTNNQNVNPPIYVNVEMFHFSHKSAGFLHHISKVKWLFYHLKNKNKKKQFSVLFHPIMSCEEVHNLTL